MEAYGPVVDAYTSCSQFVAGNLSWSAVVDPCFCVHNRSLDDADAQLPYYEIHYCALPCAPAVMYVLAALWLALLFSLVGSTADEYIVPSLERLSDQLRLSPNVAGVTLLALGNGAPEFFTMFSAFKEGHGGVAVGSLLGGGMFITSVVLGAVAVIAPFSPHRRPFMRDALVYLLGVVVLGSACLDGKITTAEASVMVALYVGYALLVVFGRVVYQNLLKPREMALKAAAAAGAAAPLNRRPAAAATLRRRGSLTQMLRLDDFAGKMNLHRHIRQQLASARRGSPLAARSRAPPPPDGRSSMVQAVLALSGSDGGGGGGANAGGADGGGADGGDGGGAAPGTLEAVLGYSWAWHSANMRAQLEGEEAAEAAAAEAAQAAAVALAEAQAAAQAEAAESGVSPLVAAGAINGGPSDAAVSSSGGGDDDEAPPLERMTTKSSLPLVSPLRVPWAIEKLKAASGWEEKGTLARLSYPVELLFIVLRDLTIPMVEEEKYSRPVCALSLGGAAQFVTFVVVGRGKWLGLDDEDRNSTLVGGVMPISVVVLLASLLPVALLYWRLDPKAPPTGGLATALLVVGFASSILWTNELADELVAALQYLGTALGVSPSILGLTVLAWGNSLGDLIADTALARAGNPRMGAASCFGSPLFNMMIGCGLSLVYATSQNGPFCLPKDKVVPISLVALVASTGATAVAVPAMGFKLTASYGKVLMGYYAVYLVATLCFQLVPDAWFDAHVWSWFKLGAHRVTIDGVADCSA